LPIARCIAINLIDIPVVIMTSSSFLAIVLPMMGARGNVAVTWGIFICAAIVAHAQALVCAHTTTSAMRGFFMFGFLTILHAILAGYYVTRDEISGWLRPLINASYIHWTIGALMRNTFIDLLPPQGEAIVTYFSFENIRSLECIWIFALFYVVHQVFLYIAIMPSRLRNVKEVSKQNALLLVEHGNRDGSFSFPPNIDSDEVKSPVFDISRESINSDDSDNMMVSYFAHASVDLYEEVSASVEDYVPSLMEPYDYVDDFYLPSVDDERGLGFKAEDFDMSEIVKALPQSRMVTLKFKDIGCTINEKRILKNISGVARPGELIAIMGSNGAGKSTLLNILAGKVDSSCVTGQVFCNGKKMESLLAVSQTLNYPLFAYVGQEDIHSPLLTVRETLNFAVMLRLHITDKDSVWCTTENLLRQLQLNDIANTLVGAISTGERRRLSVAVETSNFASLIFLDEATSGLDFNATDAVVDVLRYLADSSRTVICTIHQPHQSIFSKVNKVLICMR
jgi:ABC-type multidrug transport system ATPase subunit